MPNRPPKRTYKESQLGLWRRRVSADWERNFGRQEIEYGRALYKAGCVREIELNENDAFITARLEDGSEPFCILDFDGDNFLYVPTTSTDHLYGALKVAGFYEIEEFIIDLCAERELSGAQIPDGEIAQEAQQPEAGESAGKAPQEGESSAQNSGGGAESASEDGVPAKASMMLSVNFSSKRKGLVFEAFWRSGEKRRAVFGDKSPTIEELDETERTRLMNLVSMARKAGFKFEENEFVLSDLSKISPFLKDAMKSWKKCFIVRKDWRVDLLMLGERKITLAARAKTLSDTAEDFDVDWLPSVDGKPVSMDDMSKIFKGASSVQVLPDYGIVRISNRDSDFVKNVERAREFGFENGKIPKYMLLALSQFGENMVLSDDLKKWVDTLVSGGEKAEISGLGFLRNYQRKAVSWVLNLFAHGCNAMIADEMGLGKTIQTLGIFHALSQTASAAASARGKADMKFLVVCPASVIPVWVSEVRKFFPKLKTQILTSKMHVVSAGLTISSYTQLRRNKALFDGVKFDVAVLDEAQFIKNPDSKTTAACMSISAFNKLALTGTPVENRMLDMWTSFRFLMPGLMGNRRRFEEIVQNSQEAVALVRRQISPFVLRRMKTDVAKELPEKIYIDLLCPMSDFQKSEYEKILSEAKREIETVLPMDSKRRFTVLSLLTRLRQTCCDSRLLPWVENADSADVGGKISVLGDRLEELLLGGKKVLIFSQFTKFLDLIRSRVEQFAASEKIYQLTGSTRDRSKPVEAFQNSKESAVMLVSLRAGGTGITLTSAVFDFIADPWWNPAVEEQAIDRVHRIGRRGDVFVYRLVSQGTVEDRVRRLQVQKKGLFNELVGGLEDVSNYAKFTETVRDIISI